MKKYYLAFTALITLFSCEKAEPELDYGYIIKDIDGNSYHTIQIDKLTWMVENLKVTRYRNGDPVSDVYPWTADNAGRYCWPDNDASKIGVYGCLYNWWAVMDSRGLAPQGWHIASETEWKSLIDYLGGETVAGRKLKEAGFANWADGGLGILPIDNSSGFTALPAGYTFLSNLSALTQSFSPPGNEAYFWTTTAVDDDHSLKYGVVWNSTGTTKNQELKMNGLSVRCVKN